MEQLSIRCPDSENSSQFLSSSFASKEQFIEKYETIYGKTAYAEDLYVIVLTQLEKFIPGKNCKGLQTMSNFLSFVDKANLIEPRIETMCNFLKFIVEANLSDPVDRSYGDGIIVSGPKPLHIAAKYGFVLAFDYLCLDHFDMNDVDRLGQSVYHYAASTNRVEIFDCMVLQAYAEVNVKDNNGLTPLHVAAKCGSEEFVRILLEKGAFFDSTDKSNRKPIDLSQKASIVNLLASTAKLFTSVKDNERKEVESAIRDGAFVNAKNSLGVTALHLAASKGYDDIVDILLKNKADPNAIGSMGVSPLHYACKQNHLGVVKTLLSHGAIFNLLSDNNKSPVDFTKNIDIANLWHFIKSAFTKVQSCDTGIIEELNMTVDADMIRAVMNARSIEYKSLTECALKSKFSKLNQLRKISEGDVSGQVDLAVKLTQQGNHEKALPLFRCALQRRLQTLQADNSETLDCRAYIATCTFNQGRYRESLKIYEELVQKRIEINGPDAEITYLSKCSMALTLHTLGRNEEAFAIYEEVYEKLLKIRGSIDSEILNIRMHMGLVLDVLKKYDEALSVMEEVFAKSKELLGPLDSITVMAENNIAVVHSNRGEYAKAAKIYNRVVGKKEQIYGKDHMEVLRTQHNIATIYGYQNKPDEALELYRTILKKQMAILPSNHPHILDTRCNMAHVLVDKCSWVAALKLYREILEPMKVVYGSSYDKVLEVSEHIKKIEDGVKEICGDNVDFVEYAQSQLFVATHANDLEHILRVINMGADINQPDAEGRTPLHFAISNENEDIVKVLLASGADVTRVTSKGNSTLHIATSKNNKRIASMLLEFLKNTDPDKVKDFVNLRTTLTGTSALHVAAKNGFLEIATLLLKNGANVNLKNNDGKMTRDLTADQKIIDALKCAEQSNKGVK